MENSSNYRIQVKNPLAFKQGETFDNYEELVNRLEANSRESFVYYWRRDSRTVKGASMKTTRPILNRLKFYSLRLSCIYGGQPFIPRSKGNKPSQTNKTNCQAYVAIRASKCGTKLEVIAVDNVHNHEISEKSSEKLPHLRKLSKAEKREVFEMLDMKIPRKLIIEYVEIKTGKNVKQKDILNMAASNRMRTEYNEAKSQALFLRITNYIKVNRNTSRTKMDGIRRHYPQIIMDNTINLIEKSDNTGSIYDEQYLSDKLYHNDVEGEAFVSDGAYMYHNDNSINEDFSNDMVDNETCQTASSDVTEILLPNVPEFMLSERNDSERQTYNENSEYINTNFIECHQIPDILLGDDASSIINNSEIIEEESNILPLTSVSPKLIATTKLSEENLDECSKCHEKIEVVTNQINILELYKQNLLYEINNLLLVKQKLLDENETLKNKE